MVKPNRDVVLHCSASLTHAVRFSNVEETVKFVKALIRFLSKTDPNFDQEMKISDSAWRLFNKTLPEAFLSENDATAIYYIGKALFNAIHKPSKEPVDSIPVIFLGLLLLLQSTRSFQQKVCTASAKSKIATEIAPKSPRSSQQESDPLSSSGMKPFIMNEGSAELSAFVEDFSKAAVEILTLDGHTTIEPNHLDLLKLIFTRDETPFPTNKQELREFLQEHLCTQECLEIFLGLPLLSSSTASNLSLSMNYDVHQNCSLHSSSEQKLRLEVSGFRKETRILTTDFLEESGFSKDAVVDSVMLSDCLESTLYFCFPVRFVFATSIRSSRVVFPAVSGCLSVVNCRSLRLHACAYLIRLENCYQTTLHVTQKCPLLILSDTRNTKIGPYNVIFNMQKKFNDMVGLDIQDRDCVAYSHVVSSSSADLTRDECYSFINPQEFWPLIIPGTNPKTTTYTPAIPESYRNCFIEKLDLVVENRNILREILKSENLEDSEKDKLISAIRSQFVSWLQKSGNYREILELRRLSADRTF